MRVVNPLTYQDWDDRVLTFSDYSVSHSQFWAKTLYDAYGYSLCYFAEEDRGAFHTVIPVMEIKSIITGIRGVCLPFTDFCVPITISPSGIDACFKRIVEYGRIHKWNYIETRGWDRFVRSPADAIKCYEHVIHLGDSESRLYAQFRHSTQRNIKKAITHKLTVSAERSFSAVGSYYSLHCATRRSHGLPPQPFSFFSALHANILKNNRGFIVLARYNNKPVAGAVFLLFGKKALYKYGASSKRFQFTRANNLVMWHGITQCVRNGCHSLSLGKTSAQNKGLLQFKNGWAADKKVRYYSRYSPAKECDVAVKDKVFGVHRHLFRVLPLPLLQIVSRVVYRHIG